MGNERDLEIYSKEEALLRKWEERIRSAHTRRTELLETLLNIIRKQDAADNRLHEFNKVRSRLLGPDHNQGWTWTPSQLLPAILFFLPAAWQALQPGSKLRKVLEQEPAVNTNLISFANTLSYLSDQKFEEKIFSENTEEHTIALKDVLSRITDLKSTQYLGKEIVPSQIRETLEHTNAIKFRLTPATYLSGLETLFRHFPAESFTYYYQLYLKDPQEIPEAQNFIEYHLMANTLMEQFVLPKTSFQSFYSVSHLLMVLIDNPRALLSKLDDRGGGKVTLIDPSAVYYEVVKESIAERLRTGILEEARPRKTSKVSNEIPLLPSTPIELLADFLENYKPKPEPLVMLVARQACEIFLQELQRAKLQTDMTNWSSFCLEMIRTLTKIVDPTIVKQGNFKKEIQAGIDLLNPMINRPSIPQIYKRAEKYAVEIILRMTIPNEISLYILRKLGTIDTLIPLAEEEFEWIAFRIEKAAPGLISKENLRKNLTFKPQFDQEAVSQLSAIPFSIQTLAQALQSLKQAIINQSYEDWGKTVEGGVAFFNNYINDCQKDSTPNNSLEVEERDLIGANDLLKEIRPYLCLELYSHWKDQLYLLDPNNRATTSPLQGSPIPGTSFFANSSSGYRRLDEPPNKPPCFII